LNPAEVTKNQLITGLVSFLVDLLVDRFTLFTHYLFDISLLNLQYSFGLTLCPLMKY